MTHLAKQKTTFSLAAFALLLVMSAGMLSLRGADFTSPIRALDAGLARAEYSRFSGDTLWSSLVAMFAGQDATAAAEGTTESVPALVYHGIVANPDRFNISQAQFKEQMYALKKAGYRTVTLQEFMAFQRGEKDLPMRSFLLTFDDGRRDSFEGADPVLEALGFTAVMFMPASETVDDPKWLSSYYLSLNDVKGMIQSKRWEIGSHATQKNGGMIPIGASEQGNFLSNKQWLPDAGRHELDEEYRARLLHELAEAKHGLEREFRVKVETFSYPFGDYGQQTVNHPPAAATISNIVGDTYRAAFRQVWQHDGDFIANTPHDDRLRLKRIEVPTSWSGAELISYLEEGIEKTLPFEDDFSKDAGWRSTWGAAAPEQGTLRLHAAGTTGASVFLDGTRLWKDYAYRVNFDWSAGTNVTLLARYKDGKNYLSCTFGGGHVSISNTVDGKTYDLLRKENAVPVAAGSDTSLGMRVRGGTASCFSGATAVASANVPDSDGGIGIKTWDPERDVASISLTHIRAEAL